MRWVVVVPFRVGRWASNRRCKPSGAVLIARSGTSERARTLPTVVTQADIDAAKTPRGGWTRAQTAAWGVPWPLTPGWQRRLLAGEYTPPDSAVPPPGDSARERDAEAPSGN